MYPFAKGSLVFGLIAGCAGSLIFGSLLAGFAFLVLFVAAGIVWRADEPPILSFCLAFQWVFIVAGYLYDRAGGFLEEMTLGDVDGAIFLSLIGLLCVAVGLRAGIHLLDRRLLRHREVSEAYLEFEIRKLFLVTIITYSVSWVIEISPMDMMFNAAQIIFSVLSFREVLLALLWLTILRRREGYKYGVIAFVIAVVPRFISKQSTFKELVFMMLIVAVAEFRPWIKDAVQRRWHRRLATALISLSILLVIAGAAWEGAIKPIWRNLEIEGSPTEKLETFIHITEFAATEADRQGWLEALVSRISSITQFALVLDRVPQTVPHEDGRLTIRAIKHIVVPRVLFPNKENLGTDSWMAEEFAGLTIGEDTSVGIGYMAEFYVDWGRWGMMPCLLVLGLFLGIAYALIYLLIPSYEVARALVIVPFMANFITYEATLPKLLGGFIMTVVLLIVLSRYVPRILRLGSPSLAPEPAVVAIR
jgi:hypothetical protein